MRPTKNKPRRPAATSQASATSSSVSADTSQPSASSPDATMAAAHAATDCDPMCGHAPALHPHLTARVRCVEVTSHEKTSLLGHKTAGVAQFVRTDHKFLQHAPSDAIELSFEADSPFEIGKEYTLAIFDHGDV
jgi:hypothetical protein